MDCPNSGMAERQYENMSLRMAECKVVLQDNFLSEPHWVRSTVTQVRLISKRERELEREIEQNNLVES